MKRTGSFFRLLPVALAMGAFHAAAAPDGRELPAVGQRLAPAGVQADLPKLRPQAVALSPDGTLLLTAGKTSELLVLDPAGGAMRQRVALPSSSARPGAPAPVSAHILKPDKTGQLSYTGLLFAPDGRTIYLSNVEGDLKVFTVGGDGAVAPGWSLPLPPSGVAKHEDDIPAGLALSADGARIYVALNLSNRLLEMEAKSGKALRLFDVGVAPYDVRLCGRKAYVSNWGGRRPDAGSLTGPAGRGTRVRVDPVRHIASEGSVTVVDLDAGRAVREILTGLHACALALAPDGKRLYVANAGSDTLSAIDTATDAVVETLSLRGGAADPLGASPNALAFDAEGRFLYVCHGTQNAVGVVALANGRAALAGLIPVGWYPGAIAVDARRRQLCVANIKGIGSGLDEERRGKHGFNSHQYHGTLSLVPVPDAATLSKYTRTVRDGFRQEAVAAARLAARPDAAPRPVPERVGEPSVFRHVVYIIKENRTYDQVLGDMKEGDGDASLCVFGERITPNQHRMSRAFVLLDRTCCSGVLSADGHQWADSAFATDYMEKSFAGFPRSYPDGMGDGEVDALAYSPGGFLWDLALAHGRTLRDYGEFTIDEVKWKDPARRGEPSFKECYDDFAGGKGAISFGCRPAIESLRSHICTNTVGWNLSVPDALRADRFIAELRAFERQGELPNLIFICLPNDHTSGTKGDCPTPAAMVADNDLAFGRIVEALSHSRFWTNTCVFAIEDDPQGGWDHRSSYRTTAYVVSPWTRRGAVVHTPYNQTSLVRTMELILGLPPMNQFDAAATPMRDCFAEKPDFTPYDAVPSNVPLDQMNAAAGEIADPRMREYARLSDGLPLEEVDRCPEDLLNRILWHAQQGPEAAYPEWAVSRVAGPDKD